MQSLESGMGYGYSCHVHTPAAGPTGSAPLNTCKHNNTKHLHDPQTTSSLFCLPISDATSYQLIYCTNPFVPELHAWKYPKEDENENDLHYCACSCQQY